MPMFPASSFHPLPPSSRRRHGDHGQSNRVPVMCVAAAGTVCCRTSRLGWKTGVRKASQVSDCCGAGSSSGTAAAGTWGHRFLLWFPLERPEDVAALPCLLGEAHGEPQQLRFSKGELFLSRGCWQKWSLCGKRCFLSWAWFWAVASADLWLLALIFVASWARVGLWVFAFC